MLFRSSNTQADEHVKSALDVMCEQLDPSISSFDEDFPNYDPNTSTIPVKNFKYISNSLTEQMAKLAKSVGYGYVYLMKHKSESFEMFKLFRNEVEK